MPKPNPVKIDKKIINAKVITDEPTPAPNVVEPKPRKKQKRPEILYGSTLKLRASGYNIYVTINCDDTGKPLEIFFNSSHLESYEWVALATRLSSMILRSSDTDIASLENLAHEFIKTEAPNRFFGKVINNKKGSEHNGVIQFIGRNLLVTSIMGIQNAADVTNACPTNDIGRDPNHISAGNCPECGSDHTTLMDKCLTCLDCGDSKCG